MKCQKALKLKQVLRQGDALSPILFNLALKQMLRYMKDNRSMELLGNRTLLAYADDIVILEKSQKSDNFKYTVIRSQPKNRIKN